MAEPEPDQSIWLLHTQQQRRDLKRMQCVAAALLAAMAALYVLTEVFGRATAWLAYPRAFAEAGIVGACADWFAVVALFRHPLGVPIPHTAIIRRNKERIGVALGKFIAKNFLAPEEVTSRIKSIDMSGWIAAWLQEPASAALVISRTKDVTPPLLDFVDREKIRSFSRNLITRGVESVALAPLLARILSVVVSHGHYAAAFDFAADATVRFIVKHRDEIRQRVVKRSAGAIVGWIDTRLAEAAIDELLDMLAAARGRPDHPWRTEGRKGLEMLIARLAHDPAMEAQLEKIKSAVLSQDVIAGYLDWLVAEVEAKVSDELGADKGLVSTAIARAMRSLGGMLGADDALRGFVNQAIERIVLSAVVAGRDEIGNFVTSVVTGWDTDTLVERIELEFGRDLQYIRLNGTVVGGVVGLTIYTVTRLFR